MIDKLRIAVGICREDDPADVDEAYGKGTYERLFPSCDSCGSRDGVKTYPGRSVCPTDLGDEIREYDENLCDECAQGMGRI